MQFSSKFLFFFFSLVSKTLSENAEHTEVWMYRAPSENSSLFDKCFWYKNFKKIGWFGDTLAKWYLCVSPYAVLLDSVCKIPWVHYILEDPTLLMLQVFLSLLFLMFDWVSVNEERNSFEVNIPHAKLSDAGEYLCSYTAGSNAQYDIKVVEDTPGRVASLNVIGIVDPCLIFAVRF